MHSRFYSRGLILHLDNDVLATVYSYLTAQPICTLALVCRRLRDSALRHSRQTEAIHEQALLVQERERRLAEQICRRTPCAGLVGCQVQLPHGREVLSPGKRAVRSIQWTIEAWGCKDSLVLQSRTVQTAIRKSHSATHHP